MNENLYHKLLGLPENLDDPNYYHLLEMTEGTVISSAVEEAYKKQIQKVQRFTNNPKYKEGALFVKGELRKARSTLVDEARRMAYQRDLMTQRAQQIRGILRPLLIKGYLVEEEYKYLNQHAKRLGVPEPVVQQVLKQELQKKGIDPASALVEGSSVPGKVKSKALPVGPQRKKKGAPMSLAARWRVFRDPVGALGGLLVWPLRAVGLVASPSKSPVPAQPLQAGFFDEHPFVATSLFWLGLVALAVPLPFVELKTKIDTQKDAAETWKTHVASLEKTKKKLQAENTQLERSGGKKAQDKLSRMYAEKRALEKALAAEKKKLQAALSKQVRAQEEVAELQKKLANAAGGGGDSRYVKLLENNLREAKAERDDYKRRWEQASKGGTFSAELAEAKKQRDAARAEAQAKDAQLQVLTKRSEGWQEVLEGLKIDLNQPLGKIAEKFSSGSRGMRVVFPAHYAKKVEANQKLLVFLLKRIHVQVFARPDFVSRAGKLTAMVKLDSQKETPDAWSQIEKGQAVGVMIVE